MVARFFDSSKFGNAVKFPPPPFTPPNLTGIVFPSPNPTPIPSHRQALIEVDLSTQDMREGAGSWVFTCDTNTKVAPLLGPSQPFFAVCPLVCTISIGSGGMQQTFQCDARNQSFQLPAANVKIFVDWDQTLPPWYWSSAGAGWVFPTEAEVVANIQRAFSQGRATRSIQVAHFSGGNAVQYGTIPNFARCVRLWGPRNDGFWTDPTPGTLTFYCDQDTSGNGLGKIISYSPANLLNPAGVPVPVGAQYWELIASGGAVASAGNLYSLEFDLNL